MRIICRSSDVFSSDLLLALRKGAADDQVLDVLGIDAGARQQAAHHLRRHLVGPQLHHLALVGEVERRADVAGDHNVLLHHQRPFVSSRRGRSPSCLWLSGTSPVRSCPVRSCPVCSCPVCSCPFWASAACLARSSAISSFFDSLPMIVLDRKSTR